MFAVKRIVRSQLSLNKHLYTSSIIRCNKPKDPKSEQNEFKSKKKFTVNNKLKTISGSTNKKKLTAELNAKDYANFKSQNLPKVELYAHKSSQKEKAEAEEALQTLSNEISKVVNVDTPINEKLKTLEVPKPKVKTESRNKLVKSARSVALELGGDVKKTEGDILGYLKSLQLKTEKRKFEQENADIANKVKQTPRHFKADGYKSFRERPGNFRDRQINSQGSQEQQVEYSRKVKQDYNQNMNDRSHELRIRDFIQGFKTSKSKTLGIFNATEFKDDGLKLKTWDELEELELKVAATVPPCNYFEELIQWTEEGKLWHFPIDNDQDNEAEANIDFTEHVFLEEYLEPWCPKQGPLRHFMELVLTGLRKNHYFSVEEKREHIFWYRDYFEGKKKLLLEMEILEGVKVLPKSAESNSKPESSA